MASFSLTEKLAVTGAFLALVALAVGTEDDPGVVIAGQKAVVDMRPTVTTPAPERIPAQLEQEPPEAAPSPTQKATQPVVVLPGQPIEPEGDEAKSGDEDDDGAFNPKLGRVPRDFSNGPPPG